VQISELHYYAADTLARLERSAEAERSSSRSSRSFRRTSARAAGWRLLYQGQRQAGRSRFRVLEDMLRITPAPESYALAARLYTMFGNRKQADQIRAQGRRAAVELRIQK